MDMLDKFITYENGDLDHESTLELFQELVNNGQAWTLQGHYGRTAKSLLDQGLISSETSYLNATKGN